MKPSAPPPSPVPERLKHQIEQLARLGGIWQGAFVRVATAEPPFLIGEVLNSIGNLLVNFCMTHGITEAQLENLLESVRSSFHKMQENRDELRKAVQNAVAHNDGSGETQHMGPDGTFISVQPSGHGEDH